MIIIIKKNDSFEIVRPIYHLHTHAYTHIRVFYSFFIIIIFFFFVHSVYRDELKNEAAKMEKRQKCDTVDGAG